MNELQRELAEKIPEARRLEFSFDNTGHKRSITMRIGGSLPDLAQRARGRSDPGDGQARTRGPGDADYRGHRDQSRGSLRWVLARIRERSAYAKLRERARELDELKAQF